MIQEQQTASQQSVVPTATTGATTAFKKVSNVRAFDLNKEKIKSDLPELRPGMTVRIHQKIKEIVLTEKMKGKIEEKEKERIQVFEGIILAIKHGRGLNSTMTVRKVSEGVGVERIFPLHLPSIQKIEIMKETKVRRSKLYYLRNYKKKLREKTVKK